MKLQTQIPLTKAPHQIDYSSRVVLLGSCFSEHIGAKLDYFKFQNIQNPFGILFHPLAIENVLTRSLQKEFYTEEEVFYHNERWHCFDAHSILSNASKESLLSNLNTAIRQMSEQVEKASHIIVTLGTAWAYRHMETNNWVANCHKMPQVNFSKDLIEIELIVERLEHMVSLVRSVNSTAQFIFTVSPVRHLKDGFEENQRSKAHLISAVHKVINKGKGLYFPSYEIMMDELRDYRFYLEDMVHPSAQAIDYIWEKFVEVWIFEDAWNSMYTVDIIQKGLNHRPFHPSGSAHQTFVSSLKVKITEIEKAYPHIHFNFPKL